MKKIILPALLVGGLTLFSFTKPTEGGVHATGKNLEQKATGLKYAQNLTSSNDGAYDLKKTQLVISTTNDDVENMMKGNWIFKSKLTMSIFDANFITWETPTPADGAQVEALVQKYTNSGYTKVGNNAYNVNSSVKLTPEHDAIFREFIQKQYNLSQDEIKKSHTKDGITLTLKAL